MKQYRQLSRISSPCKVGGQFFGHVDDVLLRAELVMVGKDILEVDLVLVEQGLHPRSIVAGKSNAQRRKDIRHNLEMKWLQKYFTLTMKLVLCFLSFLCLSLIPRNVL